MRNPFGSARLADDDGVVALKAEDIQAAIDGQVAPPPERAEQEGWQKGDQPRSHQRTGAPFFAACSEEKRNCGDDGERVDGGFGEEGEAESKSQIPKAKSQRWAAEQANGAPEAIGHKQLGQRVVVHAGHHRHVLRDEGEESGGGERDDVRAGEDFEGEKIGENDDAAAEDQGEQPKDNQIPLNRDKKRGGQKIIQGGLVSLVADCVNRQRRRKPFGGQFGKILLVVVVGLQDGKGALLDEVADVVIVRRLIWHLPRWGAGGVEAADEEVGKENTGQSDKGRE